MIHTLLSKLPRSRLLMMISNELFCSADTNIHTFNLCDMREIIISSLITGH